MRDDPNHAFLVTMLREVDPSAELVECVWELAPPGYRIQLRVSEGLTKSRHLSGILVERAREADPVADYALRAVLADMILAIESHAGGALSGRPVPLAYPADLPRREGSPPRTG